MSLYLLQFGSWQNSCEVCQPSNTWVVCKHVCASYELRIVLRGRFAKISLEICPVWQNPGRYNTRALHANDAFVFKFNLRFAWDYALFHTWAYGVVRWIVTKSSWGSTIIGRSNGSMMIRSYLLYKVDNENHYIVEKSSEVIVIQVVDKWDTCQNIYVIKYVTEASEMLSPILSTCQNSIIKTGVYCT